MCHLQKSDTFATSSLIGMPLISFSCLTALAGTSRTVLNKSSESGHSYIDFREKAFSFLPLKMVLAEGLSYMAFIMLRYFFLYTFY